MDRIKVARSLVRLAKSLVAAGDVADNPGDYEDFTGTIKWGKTNCKVENATFTLGPQKGRFVWHKGTWIDGVCDVGELQDVIFGNEK